MAGLISRLLAPLRTKSAGGYWLPITGGWLPPDAGGSWNWWQMGYDVVGGASRSAMVEACISAYSQTVAMCPGDHWRLNEQGGRDRVTNSALSRILRRPNSYQTISDFLLNATRHLYADGNAYALALRNDRFEISELHLMNPSQSAAQIAVTGDVFYNLGGNDIIDRRLNEPLLVPSRDVLHIRLHSSRNPLKGESPLCAAALDVAAGNAMAQQQIAFYVNGGRPSLVLGTDKVLTKAQADEIRQRWNEQAQGLHAGGVPILAAGLKPVPLSISAKDAEVAELMKLSEQHIALAFRMPLQLLGIGETPFASTEALMQFWLASGLGFCLNHIEEAFGQLFSLRGVPDEYVEFDTKALLRSSFKEMLDALSSGTRRVMTTNEARSHLDLPRKDGGDEILVQQQDIPLSMAGKAASAPAAPTVEEDDEVADDNERAVSVFRAYRASQRHVAV